MCGIAGWVEFERGRIADTEAVGRACARMEKRGPDGEGLVVLDEGRVVLGHRRLAILDPTEDGAQPMGWVEEGGEGNWITFNGEIYNYRELREELRGKGYRFRTGTDTEVLLALYAEHGTALFRRLRGMYALGIWDARARRLVLGRDSLGIKPLYWQHTEGRVRFASQVKALLTMLPSRPELDAAGEVGFLLWGHVPDPFTLYRGIEAVPAGAFVVAEEGREPRVEQHWDLTARIREAEGGGTARTLQECLSESVGLHLVADVEVGLFLSAGRDSSVIAALAEECAGTAMRAVTLGFDEFRGTDLDETELAALTAGHVGARHEVDWIRKPEFEAELPGIFDAMDQPTIDGVNTYFVSRAAARHGLKVALSGLGGDELFGGYSTFERIPRMVQAAKRMRALRPFGPWLRRMADEPMAQMLRPKYAGIPEYGWTYGGAYLLTRGLFLPWEIEEMLGRERFLAGWHRLGAMATLEGTCEGIESGRLRVSALETSWYMKNQLLRDADWAGMAHSVEIRVPFVDAAVVEEVARLAAAGRACGKVEMAQTPARSLPEAVVTRKKTGFFTPVRQWVQEKQGGEEPSLRQWARLVFETYTGERVGTKRRARRASGVMVLGPYPGNGSYSIWNYFRNCVDGLAECGVETRSGYPAEERWGLGGLPGRVGRTESWVENFGEWPWRLRSERAELFHIVDHGLAWYARFLGGQRYVVTVHDLINYMTMNGTLALQRMPPRREMIVEECARWIREAEHVMAVSRHTADCVIRELGVSAARITVTPNHVDARFRVLAGREELRRKWFGEAGPVVVHVGKRSVYKNRVGAIRAFGVLAREMQGAGMWLVHGEASPLERAAIAEAGVAGRVHFLAPLATEELVEFYNGADVLVFPSHYEGFGVPPLEAMACGCGVVASGVASLPEVVGDGGLLVQDPEDVSGFAAAMRRLVREDGLRAEMREKGLAQAGRFTRRRAMEAVAGVYVRVMGG